MERLPTIPVASTQAALDEARALGVEVSHLASRLDPAPGIDDRLSLDLHLALLLELQAATGDPLLPARVAADRPAAKYGPLGFVALTQPDLASALLRAAEHLAIWIAGPRLEPSRSAEGLAFDLVLPPDVVPSRRLRDVLSEVVLASVTGAVRSLTGPPPPQLTVVVDSPTARDHLAVLLAAEVVLGDRCRVLVPAAELGRPPRHADPDMARFFDGFVATELRERQRERPTTRAVQEALIGRLPLADATLPRVARSLGQSDRTLQRRLADEGTGFQEVVDDLRRTLALRLLAVESLTTASVGWLLGYEEPSSFIRAFKRWLGTTPGRYRSRLASD